MNKHRLKHIAGNTLNVSESEILEIKQLIGNFPYYPLPHVVLSKIYFEKEHYLFENALTQAAMRVPDREWLYHYIHGENTSLSNQILSYKDGGDDHISGQPVPITAIPEDETGIEDQEEDFKPMKPNSEQLESVVVLDGNKDIEQTEIEADENLNSQSNDLTEFLSNQVPENEIESTATEENLQNREEAILQMTPDNTISDDLGDPESHEHADVKEGDAELLNSQQTEMALKSMNLRKHPVYNVEEFLQTGNLSVEKEESEERDFFYWLKHPTPETGNQDEALAINPAPKTEKTKIINIIDQFIMTNPGISRPKKEFFNAENMAKRSEHIDIDFVTETLANIYYEQGNIDQAINAYEKLSLQNPLKQAYFASLIEKIKKEKR